MIFKILTIFSLIDLVICEDCQTPTCFRDSELISSRLNHLVNPCEDFYGFACGNYWDKTYNLSSSFHEFNEIYMLFEKLTEEVVEIFENEKNEDEPLDMVGTFFKSCTEKNTMKKRGITPLKNAIEKIGGWPVALGDIWDENAVSWEEMISEAFKQGLIIKFPFKFMTARLNSTNSTHFREILGILSPSLPITNDCYHELDSCNFTYDLYREFQIETAILFGADEERAEKEMEEVLQFEILLSNLTHTDFEDKDDNDELSWYANMTLAELKLNYSSLNWEKILTASLPDHITLSDNETIVFDSFLYLAAFNELIEMTPKRTIANFLIMRIVDEYLYTLIGEDKKYLNTSSPWDRKCMSITFHRLPILVNTIYVRNYFDLKMNNLVVEIIEGIRDEFMKVLSSSTWMDEETKKKAMNKLKMMKALIGYPVELLDDEKLKKHHENLTINENYFESLLSVNIFNNFQKFASLHEEINKTDWRRHSYVTDVNAFYLPLDNMIKIPAPFLQGDFIHSDRPKYLNIASLGFIVGHEMTHGFDKLGHEFDEIGNYVDWWQNETKKTFKNRFKCMVNEYDNFTDASSDLNANGTATLNENIADNGGIKLSYRYFKTHLNSNGQQLTLPNFNFTHNQLFWIISAQVWCSVHDSVMGAAMIQQAYHSLPQFRVNGPMKNMPEFAEDWKCEKNSKMNPIEKCEIW